MPVYTGAEIINNNIYNNKKYQGMNRCTQWSPSMLNGLLVCSVVPPVCSVVACSEETLGLLVLIDWDEGFGGEE